MSASRFLQSVVVAAGLGVASSSIQITSSNLSSSCHSTITSLVASPAASCFNTQGLIPLAATSGNASIVEPLNNWLSGMCNQPACSNTTVTDIVNNLTNGCTSDLNIIGVPGFTPQLLLQVLETSYPALRELVCLTDKSQNNTLCYTELFTSLQNTSARAPPVTFDDVVLSFGSLLNGAYIRDIDPSVPNSSPFCTSCGKEMFNIVEGQILGHSAGTTNITGTVDTVCGADSVNGSIPSTVSESASNSTESLSGNNGTQSASGDNSTQPAGGDNTTSFAVVQSPFGLFGILVSSLLAFSSGLALTM